jgi:hypothetical protein
MQKLKKQLLTSEAVSGGTLGTAAALGAASSAWKDCNHGWNKNKQSWIDLGILFKYS